MTHEEPVPPRALVPDTPRALEAVCLKALAKERAERYGSAAELATEIRHYLADEPVAAYRDPLLARGGRWRGAPDPGGWPCRRGAGGGR